MKSLFRKRLRGGGNRSEARDIVREAAKQLGSGATHVALCNKIGPYFRHWCKVLAAKRNLDAKTPRCEDAWSVTEINFVNSSDDHESIVGWAFQPNNEKSIQPYPSPEFLNSLSFIKKFYPTPRWGEGELIKVTHENSSNSRHSEVRQNRKNPADYNSKQLPNNQNSFTETDHASMPLDLFASKSVSCRISKSDLHKKSAFTLAEVLITLGIIGVVAALTLPSVIHKYRAEVLRTRFLQANTIVQDGVTQMRAADIDLNEVINNRDLPTLRKYIKGGDCRLPKNLEEANYWNYFENLPARQASATVLEQPYCMASGMTLWFARLYEWKDSALSGMKETKYSLLAVDINGWEQKPNVYGKDMFFWFYNGENGTLSPTGENMNVNINTTRYYRLCPGGSAEAGAGCTSKALSEADYFKKLKL